jgi:hypothetical protein
VALRLFFVNASDPTVAIPSVAIAAVVKRLATLLDLSPSSTGQWRDEECGNVIVISTIDYSFHAEARR